jgi:hypothetical protein
MIQRIQSIFLFGVFVCTVLQFFTGIAEVDATGQVYNYSIWGFVKVVQNANQLLVSTQLLLIGNAGIGILALFILFKFKNRSIQIRLSRLNLFLLVAFAAGIFFYFEHALTKVLELQTLEAQNSKTVHYALGAILPVVGIIFTLLAISAIKKDDALVRSADRIR